MKLSKEAEFLKRFALIAGEHALNTKSTMSVIAKGHDGDLVTEVDFENEKLFVEMSKKEFPEFEVIGEEFSSDKTPSSKYFLVDPIDGTVNFANGLPFWGVQAECVVDNNTIAAVIYLPELNELYIADTNSAYLNGVLLSAKSKNKPLNQIVWSCSMNAKKQLTGLSDLLGGFTGYRRIGSLAVEFSLALKGHLDCVCYFGQKRTESAGIFIGRMAGLLTHGHINKFCITNSKIVHGFVGNL